MTDLTAYQPSRAEIDLNAPGSVTVSEFTREKFITRYTRPLWMGRYMWDAMKHPELRALLSDPDGKYLISPPPNLQSSIDYTGTLADWVFNSTDGTYSFSGTQVFPVGTCLNFGQYLVRINKATGNIYSLENYPPALPAAAVVKTGGLTLRVQDDTPLDKQIQINSPRYESGLNFRWTECYR